MTFAEVTYVKLPPNTTTKGSTQQGAHYTGYAVMLQLGELTDKRRGDVFFVRSTRIGYGIDVGACVVPDSNQSVVTVEGHGGVDAMPRVGDILVGMAIRNEKKFASTCPYRMKWWSGNGKPLWEFAQAVNGPIRCSATTLRSAMRLHSGTRDGLFATFMLVVMGDVGRFVAQQMRQLPGTQPAFDLGGVSPLDFAWCIAHQADDTGLMKAISQAAATGGASWSPPPAPSEAHCMGISMASMVEEYDAVVRVAEPRHVWNAGFLRAVEHSERADATTAHSTPADMVDEYGFPVAQALSPRSDAGRVFSPVYVP